MKRLVLDPNALASGIVDPRSDRPPRLLFDALESLVFEVVVCPKLLAELRKALRKPYFREKLSAEEARKAVKRIEVVALALEDPADIEPTLREFLRTFGYTGMFVTREPARSPERPPRRCHRRGKGANLRLP